jgi:uncharacterized protein YbbC (DUF1343 family)
VKAVPVFFAPNAARYKDEKCGGVSLTVTDPERLNSVLLGLTIASILHRLYPAKFEIAKVMDLLGNAGAMQKLQAGESADKVLQTGSERIREFLAKRHKALIYIAAPAHKKVRQ